MQELDKIIETQQQINTEIEERIQVINSRISVYQQMIEKIKISIHE